MSGTDSGRESRGGAGLWCLRRREIRKIFTTYIGSARPQCVGFLGVPRSGRSTLLGFIADPGVQSRYLDDLDQYVIVLFEARRGYTGEDDLFQHLFSVVGVTGRGDGRERLGDWLKAMSAAQRRIILLVDDFHHLSQNPAVKLDFYSNLRSLANEFQLGLLVTGPKDLYSSVADPALAESPFFNIFNTINLDAVPPEVAGEFVEKVVPGADDAETVAARNWILARAGHYPFTLQTLVDLVESASPREVPRNPALAEAVTARFKEAIAGYIMDVFGGLQENLKKRFAERLHDRRSGSLSSPELHQLVKTGLLVPAGDSFDIPSPVFEDILKEGVPRAG